MGPAVAMDEIVISSTPLGRTLLQQTQPVSVLEGQRLWENAGGSLGETLSGVPGVTSTGFAPGAGRPIIRGLGEDRIRVLNHGVGLLDVSNVSPDHAVSLDPILMERVEVVRGPAALLYGPNGVGGVVNVLDGRIPEQRVEPGWNEWPVRGKLESKYGSGADLWSGAGSLDVGLGPVVLHFEGFRQESDDLRIPGDARSRRLQEREPLEAGEREASGRLPNSFTESEGGSLGASWIWDQGYIGMSWSWLDRFYGTVAEEEVTIAMEQERWESRGAWREPLAGWEEIRYHLAVSDYQHTEFEGPEVGTIFEVEGYEGRVEASHAPWRSWQGTLGYQTSFSEFSALGAEAFLPDVETENHAAFWLEELTWRDLRWQAGLRYDHTRVESLETAGFGEGSGRSFDAVSGSMGVVWDLPQGYSVAFQSALTRRAPTYVELFAEGPHLATGVYERGDDTLDLEDSLGFDLTVRKSTGRVTGSAGVFYNRFDGFIGLFPTGEETEFGEDGEMESLPLQEYRAVPADFLGGEVEWTFHLLGAAEPEVPSTVDQSGKATPPSGSSNPLTGPRLDLEWKADWVHTRLRDEGGGLPRIPPFRTSAALVLGLDQLTARLEGQYSASQDRTSRGELPTDAFFLLNAGLSYRWKFQDITMDVFLRGTNLLDEEARLHTSFLKDIAPLGGRAVVAGVQFSF